MFYRRYGKEVAAAVVLAAAAAWTIPARAQLAVADAPVETATAYMVQQQFPAILQQDTATATSVTTTTAGNQFNANNGFIASLDQGLLSQVNSQSSGQLFPVVVGLPCKSYPVMLQVAQAAGQTYQAAIAGTQRSLQELQNEDFSQTISNIQSPFLLSTLQGVGQAVMADVQERRYERQQLGMLTMVEATQHLQELDAVTRAKLERQGDGC